MLYFVLLAKSLFLLEKLVGCGAEWGLPSNLLILLDFFRGWTSRHRECIGLRYLQSNANVPGILEFLDCPHSLIVLIVYDLLEQKSTKISSFFELFLVGLHTYAFWAFAHRERTYIITRFGGEVNQKKNFFLIIF